MLARTISPQEFYVRQVNNRLATGSYAKEEVPCFCGSDKRKKVVDRDRYGISHAMHLCLHCGILYASPRMTESAYRNFYENEYRKIYDFGLDQEEEFKSSLRVGKDFKEFLDYFNVHPKRIFDIGCGFGAWGIPFKEAGCEVLSIEHGWEEKLSGQKADLIILNHVIEHFTDLDGSLAKIRDLMTEDGLLFVGTPGLYVTHKGMVFQNAHTYQFTPETLTYVMECCGFEEIYCDTWIASLWKKSGYRDKSDVSSYAVRHIHNFLFENAQLVPMIRTINKFDMKTRKDYIAKSMASGIPDMNKLVNQYSGKAVIVGGGPSVEDHIDDLFELINAGAKTFVIERMYEWALANGFVPDFIVSMDASDDVVDDFNRTHPDVIHLLAAQSPPAIWEKLAGYKVYLFNTPQKGIDLVDMMRPGDGPNTMVNSGGSVTICSMSIAMMLGFRDLHIFGFDCHITNGNYARGITGVGEIKDVFEITVDDRIFKVTAGYLSFAQEFHKLMRFAKYKEMVDSYKIYGDSLASAMSKEDIRG